MHIILGAAGQIGSMLVEHLLKKGQPVRAVVRDEIKGKELKSKGAEVAVANYFDLAALKEAFQGGYSAFLLTPENPGCDNFLHQIQMLLSNYREAIQSSGVVKIVGLSSMGAQYEAGTGNLTASYMLEQTFSDLSIEEIYVRPAYYFSNWLGYLELVRTHGILPTFFPPKLELQMIAPSDVAEFLAEKIVCKGQQKRIYEITGPRNYSSLNIAETFGDVLNRDVTLQQVLPEEWESTFIKAGFSKDMAKNFMLMTQAVLDGKTKNDMAICLATDFKKYLRNSI